jgi:GNAT superfamily N-acetyltransferase
MTATVRRLGPGDDVSEATALLQRFFAEEGFSVPEATVLANTKQLASIESCALFVAISAETTIGVATLSMEFGIEYGWSAEMGDLYVLPEWRGKGISRLLVNALETCLRDKGASGYQVTLTPFAQQHGLGEFYKSFGFESEGRLILFRNLP